MVLLIRMHSDRTFDDEDWNADLQVLSAFAPWHRNRRKRFFRLGCLQDSEHYRRVAKAARRCRVMLAHAGPAAEKVSEFVVPRQYRPADAALLKPA
jgi:hypothetical protein